MPVGISGCTYAFATHGSWVWGPSIGSGVKRAASRGCERWAVCSATPDRWGGWCGAGKCLLLCFCAPHLSTQSSCDSSGPEQPSEPEPEPEPEPATESQLRRRIPSRTEIFTDAKKLVRKVREVDAPMKLVRQVVTGDPKKKVRDHWTEKTTEVWGEHPMGRARGTTLRATECNPALKRVESVKWQDTTRPSPGSSPHPVRAQYNYSLWLVSGAEFCFRGAQTQPPAPIPLPPPQKLNKIETLGHFEVLNRVEIPVTQQWPAAGSTVPLMGFRE